MVAHIYRDEGSSGRDTVLKQAVQWSYHGQRGRSLTLIRHQH